MNVPVEVRNIVAKSAQLEASGQYKNAEAGYLKAMAELGDREPVYRGMLYINLGTNAQHDDRYEDAAGFLRRSISLLEKEKGEAHLQCAHAHFNLAYQLFNSTDPAAPAHAAEALKRYRVNPFADAVDRADAEMLNVLASIFIEHRSSLLAMRETWNDIKAVQADTLNAMLVENFMINWLALNQQANEAEYDAVRAEANDWLPAKLKLGMLGRFMQE